MESPNHQNNDDDLSSPHPAKRRIIDGALDYPRRRATIAVSINSTTIMGIGTDISA